MPASTLNATSCSNHSAPTFVISDSNYTGLPAFRPPVTNTVFNGRELDLVGMLTEIGPGIVVVPSIVIVEMLAVARAFSK